MIRNFICTFAKFLTIPKKQINNKAYSDKFCMLCPAYMATISLLFVEAHTLLYRVYASTPRQTTFPHSELCKIPFLQHKAFGMLLPQHHNLTRHQVRKLETGRYKFIVITFMYIILEIVFSNLLLLLEVRNMQQIFLLSTKYQGVFQL